MVPHLEFGGGLESWVAFEGLGFRVRDPKAVFL